MILQLYIFRQLVVTLAVFLGGIAFVVFPAVAVSAITRLGGVNVKAVLGYLPLAGMDVLPYLMPMGFLLAITSAYGRLAADNEWTAMQMARRNPYKLLLPALLIAAVFSAGTYHLLATVRPEWKYEQRVFAKRAIVDTFKDLNPGRTELQFGDFYLHAARRPAKDTFGEVLIQMPGDDERPDLRIVADRASFHFTDEDLIVRFTNARIVSGQDDLVAANSELRRPLKDIFKEEAFEREAGKYFTLTELRRRLADPAFRATLEESRIKQYLYEINQRPAFSLSFVLFVLFGAPIGLMLRRGTRLAAMSASVGVAFAYYIGSMRLGKELAKHSNMEPYIAVWSANVVALLIGMYLTWRAMRR